jgi:SAM-dependent methyltransferase
VTDNCPLCGAQRSLPYHRDALRSYRQCWRCALVFVPPGERLDRRAERAEYDRHENRVDDRAYLRFLSRLAVPLQQRLPPASRGLDFGCGPAPALAQMLRDAGHAVCLHDSFYRPAPELLRRRYDFITATEVVEHLHAPGAELERLWACLRPGGWLGIMTKLLRDQSAFANWHYKRDPTHVCFFSRCSWRWWARGRRAQLTWHGADVILLRKVPD